MEIQDPDFDYDIDGGIDGPTATVQYVSIVSDTAFQIDCEKSDYQLPPVLSDRTLPECISQFYFNIYWNIQKQDKMKENRNDTIEHPDLDWQTEENQRDADQKSL